MPAFATPEPITATVTVAGARLRVAASDRADTEVLVEPVSKASPSDLKVAARTKVAFAGGQLTVKTTKSGDKDGSVAITIGLPAGSGLVAYLAHSSVHAEGPLGECDLHLASGRVQLDRIGTLQASISAGEVAVGRIDGSASIQSRAGQIRIGRAAADLELSGADGSLDIDRADGSVTVTAAGSPIRIGRLTRGRAKLMNASGNIEIGISEDTAASVEATSERGSVRNSVPSPAGPGMSGSTLAVRARTRHGDIIIYHAAS